MVLYHGVFQDTSKGAEGPSYGGAAAAGAWAAVSSFSDKN